MKNNDFKPNNEYFAYRFHCIVCAFPENADENSKYVSKWNPDWKIESNYPNPKNAPLLQWSWEFLRRNSEYQEDFKRINDYVLKNSKFGEDMLEDIKNHYYVMLIKICEKYQITGVVNPVAPFSSNVLTFIRFQDSHYPFFYFSDEEIESKKIKPIEEDEVVIKLNVSLPINPQLQRAKRTLNHQRDSLIKKGIIKNIDNKRLREENYRDYLRIYDARMGKVPFSEIAEVIYPNLYDVDPKKKVEAAFKAAKKMVTTGYKSIPGKVPKEK